MLPGTVIGATAIGALARACRSLSRLDLSANELSDEHLDALAHGIAAGGAFLQGGDDEALLDVSLNKFSLSGMLRLQAACEAHGGVRCPV